MKKYKFTKEQRAIIEGMRMSFAISQFLEKGVVTLVISDGFCEMFGYRDRTQAYADMNQNIEITESVIGSDFDYMKVQVERFQALGFPVWMDDFGSGYSALDMLQSIKLDLL